MDGAQGEERRVGGGGGGTALDGRSDASKTWPSHHEGRGYRNPWPSFHAVGLGDVLTAFGLQAGGEQGGGVQEGEAQEGGASDTPPRPDFDRARVIKDSCRATWLGHATYLVELPPPREATEGTRGLTLLFDPVFSQRASPSQYLGPRRFVKAACQPDECPPVDMVLISHNHYDHLDVDSILGLEKAAKNRGRPIHYFVPLGHLAWFEQTGVDPSRVKELDWWEHAQISMAPVNAFERDSLVTLDVLCVPAQHGSGRGLTDQNTCLWASWYVAQALPLRKKDDLAIALASPHHIAPFSVYFAGDTGYRYLPPNTPQAQVSSLPACPIFKELATQYRPPTLSLLPISNGSTLTYLKRFGINPISPNHLTSAIHSNPKDAVAMHLDLQSKYSCPMHYGTFVSDQQETLESLWLLKEACQQAKVGLVDQGRLLAQLDTLEETAKGHFLVPSLGQVLEIPSGHTT